ncbi:Iota-carrageenase precursor [Planctomycetes bacterium CA13]|uniref:Iota-carrageenase n=1 Tax=Novipirellula herctigrandis TaxID=2527986 RepID=A0A5C5YYP5_9BACT|nr:Iota-carrageenase precursor [Planctomycetes bacterium CA13]
MKHLIIALAFLICCTEVHAKYRETMDPNGPMKNLHTDFGLKNDGAKSDQSDLMQKAIQAFSAAGGGRLIMPKGTYMFSGVCLASNVHLLIEKDTVIKPYWPKGGKAVVFQLTPYSESRKRRQHDDRYVENVSIRGLGGTFIIDYSNRKRVKGEGIRAVNCRMAKNFLLSDFEVKDNWTTYCAIIFTPSSSPNAKSYDVYMPVDGLVKNCHSTHSSPGYGLVQMHGGRDIHFENLSTTGGGVTFRLETGAGGEHGGIYDISAKDLYCEDGKAAVLMGPHVRQNGMVMIDGVKTKGCFNAVQMGSGFVDQKKRAEGVHVSPGSFADGSTVKNIHAIFGTNAPIATKSLARVPKEYLSQLRIDERETKSLRGPSVCAVTDRTQKSWRPVIQNVTSEGFKYNPGVVTLKEDVKGNLNQILTGMPILEEFEKHKKKLAEEDK